MSSVIDFSQYLNSAIQAGSSVEGTAVKVIADNGAEIGDAVYKVIEGGNGVASEVGVATQAGAGGLVATGLAYLSMSLPSAMAGVAAALGVAVGYYVGGWLYEMEPQFWTDLSDKLFEAGQTVGGKVLCYWNGSNLYMDEKTIEIVKQTLVDYEAFTGREEISIPEDVEIDISPFTAPFVLTHIFQLGDSISFRYQKVNGHMSSFVGYTGRQWYNLVMSSKTENDLLAIWQEHLEVRATNSYTFNDRTVYYNSTAGSTISDPKPITGPTNLYSYEGNMSEDIIRKVAWLMEYGDAEGVEGLPLQPGAVIPGNEEFPLTYPDWYPFTYDPTLPDPGDLPDIYPLKYPNTDPTYDPDQGEAQDPDPEEIPIIIPIILPDFPIPDPGTGGDEEPEEEDPDPAEEDPDPLPEDDTKTPGDDPVDPNGDPDPSVPIVVPPLPDTVNSTRLFTVYNPTSSQLDALGGYLWDSSIIAAIRDIWQEPMDGLISLQQVFVTPTTSGNHNIILGFLDSGVSAKVVSNQFVTVDCGSVQVKEDKKNATDYAPYTSLHLYLPFIGIVELDTNECMNATISVKYKVDVYTGTCLAQVSVDRDLDMPNDPILYTFSGNCSQQLPLTSGNSTGILSALLAGVGVGVSVASGGGLSTVAGYHLAGSSLTHEMMHVSHSGNISANAGIMGQKKPYLIIGRRHGYDANNYNSFYGYPANKTVNIGNHSGFIKVKTCWLKTNALQEEYEEIMRLLTEGVFV